MFYEVMKPRVLTIAAATLQQQQQVLGRPLDPKTVRQPRVNYACLMMMMMMITTTNCGSRGGEREKRNPIASH